MGNFPLENISLICLSNVSVGGRAPTKGQEGRGRVGDRDGGGWVNGAIWRWPDMRANGNDRREIEELFGYIW